MNKEQFIVKINFIFEDKNIERPSLEWIGGLYEKCKNISDDKFKSGIDKLVSIPQDQWNKTYGFRGRPSIIDLIEILSGERPLSEDEKKQKLKDDEKRIRFWTAEICSLWLNDKNYNLDNAFLARYRNPENAHLKNIIDKHLSIKRYLKDEEVKRMGWHLRSSMIADKKGFFKKLRDVAKSQNQLMLD